MHFVTKLCNLRVRVFLEPSLMFYIDLANINHSYTPRTLRAFCSQSKFRILKIRESSAHALFLYNCTPNISRSADASVSVARVDLRERRVDSFSKRVIIFCW